MKHRYPVLLATVLLTQQAAATDEQHYQSMIDDNRRQLSALATEVAAAEKERTSLLSRIEKQDQRVDERSNRIRSLEADIRHWEHRVSQLETRTGEAQSSLLGAEKFLASLIRSTGRIHRNDGLQILLQHQDPAAAARIGRYYSYILTAQRQSITDTASALQTLESASSEALKSRNWLQYLRKKAGSQKQDLAHRANEIRSALSDVNQSIDEKRKKSTNLKADQQRLTKLLEELKKRQLGASGYFVAGKGKYPYPARGKLAVHFDDLKSVGRLKWTGVVIRADAGSQVRSIADGEVVYASYLQGFGMLAVVDHGDGYMTLYGGNRDLLVKQGDWIKTGSRLATVGTLDGQAHPGLYFEVRHNARPVDPEIWIGVKNRFPAAAN